LAHSTRHERTTKATTEETFWGALQLLEGGPKQGEKVHARITEKYRDLTVESHPSIKDTKDIEEVSSQRSPQTGFHTITRIRNSSRRTFTRKAT
jgi:Ulp1 family protease